MNIPFLKDNSRNYGRWEYDYKYFQQIIEHEQRVNNKAVDSIITNLREAVKSDSSSSEDGSMPGLQDRAREESSSSDKDTKSFGKDDIYNDGETLRYKVLSLR